MLQLRRVRILAGLLMACIPAVRGERRSAPEEQVRAAFLFQLAQYVHWPAGRFVNEAAPVRFCVLGDEGLAQTLQVVVAGKTIGARPVVVRAVLAEGELARCHVAFVGFRRSGELKEFFALWQYPPVLITGEAPGFGTHGGMVNLILEQGRVSFEINLEAVQRANLELRSQLLRFAKFVPGKGVRK